MTFAADAREKLRLLLDYKSGSESKIEYGTTSFSDDDLLDPELLRLAYVMTILHENDFSQ